MFKKVSIILFIAVFFAIPFFSFASHSGGLVPCGAGESGHSACTTCDAFKLVHNVIQFLFLFILLPATAIAFLIGGVLMLTAGGNETQVTRAKSILWNTILGILIAFASFVIINTIIATLASGGINGRAWYEFPGCSGGSPIERASSRSSGSSGSSGSSAVAQENFQVASAATQAVVSAEAANWAAQAHDSLRESGIGYGDRTLGRFLVFLKNFTKSAEALTPLVIMAQQANYFADQAITLADSLSADSANEISLRIALEARSIAESSRRSEFNLTHLKPPMFFAKPVFAASELSYPSHMANSVRAASAGVIARIMGEYYINHPNVENIAVVEDVADRLFGALLIYMRDISYDSNDGSSLISLRMLSTEIRNFFGIDFPDFSRVSKAGLGNSVADDASGGAAWKKGLASIQNGIPGSVKTKIRVLLSLGGDGGSDSSDAPGDGTAGTGPGDSISDAPGDGTAGTGPGDSISDAPEGDTVGGESPAPGSTSGGEIDVVDPGPGAVPSEGITTIAATIATNVVAAINDMNFAPIAPTVPAPTPDPTIVVTIELDPPNPVTTIGPTPMDTALAALDVSLMGKAMADAAVNNPNAPNTPNMVAGAIVAIETAMSLASAVLGQPPTMAENVNIDSHAVAAIAINNAVDTAATLDAHGFNPDR